MASAEVSSSGSSSMSISSRAPHDAPLATVVDPPASSPLQQAPPISPASSTAATPPPPSAAAEAARPPIAARSGAGSTPPESSSYSKRFTSSSSEDDEDSSSHGSPFASARGGSSSLSSSAPSATLFVPSSSPSSFGPSAPVAAALAASMGMSQVSIAGSSSAAAAAAAAAYMASPTGHLLSRSMSASKLHMKKKKANVRYKDHCDNCLTDQTPQWRKGRRGETFCQDCGRSERRHDYARLKREREKAIEKTLVDLLENSVYVARWAHSGAAQRQRPRQLEALVEETSQQEVVKSESAESGASVASGAEPSECAKPEQALSENMHVEDGSHQEEDANKVDADAEGCGDDSVLADESHAPNDLGHDSSVVGKRKSTEEENEDEEEESGEGTEQQSTTDSGADAPFFAVGLEVSKDKPDTAVSPAAKRRRMPNQPPAQPSPVRLAKRRTSPGAQTPATSAGLENNGTPPSHVNDNDGDELRHDNDNSVVVADNDGGSTEGEGAEEASSSTAGIVVSEEAAPRAVDDAMAEE